MCGLLSDTYSLVVIYIYIFTSILHGHEFQNLKHILKLI